MDLLAATQANFHIPAVWWAGTLFWFSILLFGDLFLHRNSKKSIGLRQAIIRSIIWISLGLLLGVVIWLNFGHDAGVKYFAGFFIEKSLSVDNIFVWGIVLTYLDIPKQYHYKVLFWGIFGAILFRTLFVLAGTAVLARFEFTFVLLGFALLYTAYHLLISKADEASFDPDNSWLLKNLNKFVRFSPDTKQGKLFTRDKGRLVPTILMFAIIVVELTDVMFAIDSVPAALAVARDPYIVLASNIAAILGLRALYFVFDSLKDSFWLLNKGLAVILAFVGVSMILEPESIAGINWFGLSLPSYVHLIVVGVILALAIIGSLAIKPKSD